jgi:hypothetical protein
LLTILWLAFTLLTLLTVLSALALLTLLTALLAILLLLTISLTRACSRELCGLRRCIARRRASAGHTIAARFTRARAGTIARQFLLKLL